MRERERACVRVCVCACVRAGGCSGPSQSSEPAWRHLPPAHAAPRQRPRQSAEGATATSTAGYSSLQQHVQQPTAVYSSLQQRRRPVNQSGAPRDRPWPASPISYAATAAPRQSAAGPLAGASLQQARWPARVYSGPSGLQQARWPPEGPPVYSSLTGRRDSTAAPVAAGGRRERRPASPDRRPASPDRRPASPEKVTGQPAGPPPRGPLREGPAWPETGGGRHPAFMRQRQAASTYVATVQIPVRMQLKADCEHYCS